LRQNRAQANAQAAAAAAQVLAAQRQIDTLHAQIGVTQAQIEQAAAQVRQASADVEGSLVRASIAGRIGDRSVRPGQYVQPGTTADDRGAGPGDLPHRQLQGDPDRPHAARPPVEIKVDALGSQKLRGVVDSFAPGTGAQFALIPPSNATGNFTKIVQRVSVRIRFNAPAGVRAVLLPGLSVEAAVDTKDLNPNAAPSRPRRGGGAMSDAQALPRPVGAGGWLAVAAGTIGALMATLDTSIVRRLAADHPGRDRRQRRRRALGSPRPTWSPRS